MSETGWIILGVAVLLVLLALLLLTRGKATPSAADPLPTPDEAAHSAHLVEPNLPPIPAAPVIAPVAVAAAEGEADDLLKLKGVGPKLVALLHGMGVTSYAQIAAWTDTDLAAVDAQLGNFKGRPQRDNWIDQARFLAAGDVAGYEAKYGKL